jgi:RNase H-like domain found in reverse transcriptase
MTWVWGAEPEQAFRDVKEGLVSAPVLGHSMPNKPYHVYSDASDVAIGASLQKIQPIAVKDLKGTKIYDKIIDAHAKGKPVPKIACQALKNMNDIPDPNQWAEKVEDTIVHVE